MKVIVTGANGFVGSEICDYLEKNNFQVIKFVHRKGQTDKINENGKSKREYTIDIRHNIKLEQEFEGVEAIIHAAGLAHQFGNTPKSRFWEINVEGTQNVFDFAKRLKIKHFVLISSVSVYGAIKKTQKRKGIDESSQCKPIDDYAKSKFEAENICRNDLRDCQDFAVTILRLATVIGEGDRGNVFRLIKLIDQRKFFWVGRGENYKSLIHKNDVALAVKTVLEKQRDDFVIFNVSGEAKKLREIVNTISKSLNRSILSIIIPSRVLLKFLQSAFWLTKINKFKDLEKSITKWITDDIYIGSNFKRFYGYQPLISVEEALEREVKWYLQKNK